VFESADNAAWAIAEGHTGEYPFQVRFRRIPAGFPRAGYPRRLNIFWTMRSPDDEGLASETELEALHVFEDRLIPAVEQDESAWLVAVLTGQSEREFVFQVVDPELFLRRLTEMPQEAERYPIEINLTDDPEWAYYEAILPDERGTLQ
jgi:hypothetical protein